MEMVVEEVLICGVFLCCTNKENILYQEREVERRVESIWKEPQKSLQINVINHLVPTARPSLPLPPKVQTGNGISTMMEKDEMTLRQLKEVSFFLGYC